MKFHIYHGSAGRSNLVFILKSKDQRVVEYRTMRSADLKNETEKNAVIAFDFDNCTVDVHVTGTTAAFDQIMGKVAAHTHFRFNEEQEEDGDSSNIVVVEKIVIKNKGSLLVA